MDITPLDKAFTAGKQADASVLSGRYAEAAELFSEAAECFNLAAKNAEDNPGKPMLLTLAKQSAERAEYFKSGQANKDIEKPKVDEIKENDSGESRDYILGGSMNDLTTSILALPIGEAVSSLALRSSAVFARVYEQSITQSLKRNNLNFPANDIIHSESFYLLKPKRQGILEERIEGVPMGNANLNSGATMLIRSKALETAAKAQESVLKSGLHQIKNDIASKEQRIKDEYIAELDRLRAENDGLKIELGRLTAQLHKNKKVS